jgi:exosortase K
MHSPKSAALLSAESIMKHRSTIPILQLLVVVTCAAGLKFYYSTASVNELRWILAPTTLLVEFITRREFAFESHAGYMSSDHTFLIAASCAGVNFLITSFLMLSLRSIWKARSDRRRQLKGWVFLPVSAVIAYVASILANTVRISTALLHGSSDLAWLSRNQMHRFEGVFIYFGSLLLLFVLSEILYHDSRSATAASLDSRSHRLHQSLFPLVIYYATTLAIPLANGAYQQHGFVEHSLFVIAIPPVIILAAGGVVRLSRNLRSRERANKSLTTHNSSAYF